MTRMTNLEMILSGPYPDLELQPANGYVPQSIDFGWPALRDNRDLRPDQNGEDDFTKYFGARAVSVVVGIDATNHSDEYLEDNLKKWLLPELESYLIFRRRGSTQWRRIRLRGTSVGRRLTLSSFRYDHATLAFRAPDGVFEHGNDVGGIDFAPRLLSLSPSTELETGRIYDATNTNYNGTTQKRYPATAVVGSGIASNPGTAPADIVARFYGMSVGARLINQSTGEIFQFIPGFTITDGQYVEVNFKTGEVLLDGNPSNTRFNKVDFSVSEFFQLSAMSDTNLRYDPVSFAPPSHVEVEWLPTSL